MTDLQKQLIRVYDDLAYYSFINMKNIHTFEHLRLHGWLERFIDEFDLDCDADDLLEFLPDYCVGDD